MSAQEVVGLLQLLDTYFNTALAGKLTVTYNYTLEYEPDFKFSVYITVLREADSTVKYNWIIITDLQFIVRDIMLATDHMVASFPALAA